MQVPKRKSEQRKIRSKLDPYLSQLKYQKLTQELKELQKKQPILASEVKRLASDGDFSENAGYQLAKSQLRGLNNKILFVENQLKHAIIIENKNSEGKIQIGSQVVLEKNDQETTYTILGSSESNPTEGIISHLSPLGARLIGKKVGDKITLNTKDKEQAYTVKQVN
ncbi:MAG: GreA/GreB family elongation factor [Candidatus Pacebacteria bacterium]|nr:GreA/GreB family elongation factor [Candidatus Paceibacterota bacterium]